MGAIASKLRLGNRIHRALVKPLLGLQRKYLKRINLFQPFLSYVQIIFYDADDIYVNT